MGPSFATVRCSAGNGGGVGAASRCVLPRKARTVTPDRNGRIETPCNAVGRRRSLAHSGAGRLFSVVAGLARPGRAMPAPLDSQVMMTLPAEDMKGRFTGVCEIGAAAAVAVDAVSGPGIVPEVVMTGDAVDTHVQLVG